MTCAHYQRLLSRYHDGMLDPKQRETVRVHLQDCPECAARLAAYRTIDTRIADALQVQVRPAFRRAVFAATNRPLEARVTQAPKRRRSQIFLGSLVGGSVA